VTPLVDEQARARPGSAETETREHVGEIVNLKVQPAESDARDESDIARRRNDPPSHSRTPSEEIEHQAIDGGRACCVAARKRVRFQMNIGELGPRAVKDKFQDGVQDLDAERPDTEQRRLVKPTPRRRK
jgi:hypothetical protein